MVEQSSARRQKKVVAWGQPIAVRLASATTSADATDSRNFFSKASGRKEFIGKNLACVYEHAQLRLESGSSAILRKFLD
jgi:hypothetical protein